MRNRNRDGDRDVGSGSGSDEEREASLSPQHRSHSQLQLHSQLQRRHGRRRSALDLGEMSDLGSRKSSPDSLGSRNEVRSGSGSCSVEDEGKGDQDEEVSVGSAGHEDPPGALKEHDRWSVWTATATLHSEEPDLCSQALQDGNSEEEDPVLDAMLASSSLAVQSAQKTLLQTLSDRQQLARFRMDESALELLMGKREVELLTRLEANRQMAEYAEQRTRELQTLLRASASESSYNAARRTASYSSSTGGWSLATATGDTTVQDGNGAATQLSRIGTGFGIGIESGVMGIVEAPQDQGVTMDKSAARRLEKMLGRHQARSSEGTSRSASGSYIRSPSQARPGMGERRDAQSMLVLVAAASSAASPGRSTSTPFAGEGLRSPASGPKVSSAPYSPRKAESSAHVSIPSSSVISTVTAASFKTARSASSMATSDASGDQMEELMDDGNSSSVRALDTPISPSLSSSTSLSSPGPSRPPSYFAGATTTGTDTCASSTSSPRSTSPTSALLNRRQRLHRSHPSAPAVISVGSSTTAASSIWSPGSFTTHTSNISVLFEAGAPMASTPASISGIVPHRRPSHLQRRSASASASASGASTFSPSSPGGRITRASAAPSFAHVSTS